MANIAAALTISRFALARPLRDETALHSEAKDATSIFQALIDDLPAQGGTVSIPTGQYYINAERGLQLRSGVTLNFEDGAILKAIPTGSKKYALIKIYGADNAKISGGKVIGERASHLGSGGEWGMGISVRGSSNIQISDTQVSDCWGDGIYIGSYSISGREIPSKNILINRVTSKNNRRQGMSITSCIGADITDSSFIETSGTSPASGIDLEPNKGQPVTDILIKNCDLNDNAGSGVIFSRGSARSKLINCRLLRNHQQGIRLSGAIEIEIIKNVSIDNYKYDISIDGASKSYKLSSNTVSKKKSLSLKRVERIHIESQ